MRNLFISGSTPVDQSQNNLGEFNNLLLRALSRAGFRIEFSEITDVFVNINHNKKSLQRAPQDSRVLKVLIRTEPITVFPAQYKLRVENQYDFVITFGLPRKRYGKFLDVHHPYKTLSNPNSPDLEVNSAHNQDSEVNDEILTFSHWKSREIDLSLIAANKVSSQRESNYNLRRTFAGEAKKNELKIYGTLWNESYVRMIHHRAGVGLHAIKNGTLPSLRSLYGGLHRNYANHIGAPQDKQEIIRNSKFSLVIENSSTYVSEKLFDALVGGSIPIYFGPDLSRYGIPEENLVIRHQSSISELYSRVMNMAEPEILTRINAIKQFVESSYFSNEWGAENVFSNIAFEIAEFKKRL